MRFTLRSRKDTPVLTNLFSFDDTKDNVLESNPKGNSVANSSRRSRDDPLPYRLSQHSPAALSASGCPTGRGAPRILTKSYIAFPRLQFHAQDLAQEPTNKTLIPSFKMNDSAAFSNHLRFAFVLHIPLENTYLKQCPYLHEDVL